MSTIEPTEEQKQAAQAFCAEHMLSCDDDVARLLAEREVLAMCKGAAIAWGTLWDSNAPADVIKAAEDVKSLHHRIDRLTAHAKAADEGFAEREAKLREDVAAAMAITEDGVRKCVALRAEVARLEALCTEESRLIAERDANIHLRVAAEDRARMLQGLANTAHTEHDNDTLRARVAELEASRDEWRDNAGVALEAWERASVREAQHLADIKALAAKRLVDMREAARWGAEISANVDDATDHQIAADIMEEFATFDAEDELLQRLAHYDDAKADAPASDEHKDGPCGWSGCGRCGDTEGGEG